MDTPKVSVIVSTFNRAKLLPRCLDSILNQSFKDFEVIVVNDASTDGLTANLLAEYASRDQRVRVFNLPDNHGSDSYPKNFGINEAKAPLIAFMDDDDAYRVDGLKILYRYMTTGVDMVYGDYMIRQPSKRPEPGWSLEFNANRLQQMNFIAMPTVMVKKDCLLEVGGFDETIPKFKDWNLWLRLQKRGYKIMHVPIMTTDVYPQEESVSNKYEVKRDAQGHYLPTFFDPADCKIYATKTMLPKQKTFTVALFTMTMDRLEYTKQMAESLKKAGYPFDWFVIDQASTDGTKEWLSDEKNQKEYSIAGVTFNEKNVGIAEGWNMAVDKIKEKGGYDIIIKIDNDCELMSDNWLKTMVELFERNRTMVLSPYVEGLEDAPGGVLRQRGGGKEPYVQINEQLLGIVPNLGGICFAAPIELYKDFRFDENSVFMAGNKDYMLSMYARSSGFSLFYVEELRCWHIDGTKGQHAKYPDYFKKHYNLQQAKS